MCAVSMPKPVRPAAAPESPLPSASEVKLKERKDGPGPDAARGRSSLRTDIKTSGGSGANIPVMGG